MGRNGEEQVRSKNIIVHATVDDGADLTMLKNMDKES